MKKIQSFLTAIWDENSGYSFGEPWRYNEKSITCVLPIKRVSRKRPKYLTLAQAEKVEIVDTGSINRVLIFNREDMPVFIRMGEILKGDTQERTSVMSRIILPGTKEEIAVICVHASRGINRGARFKSHGFSPDRERMFAASLAVSGKVKQDESWAMDQTYFKKARKHVQALYKRAPERSQAFRSGVEVLSDVDGLWGSMEDDLALVRNKVTRAFDDIIRKMPRVKNQVGLALIDNQGFHSLDCFDLPASWKAIRDAIAEKEALSLAEQDNSGVFDYKPEKAKGLVKKVLQKEFSEKVLYKTPITKTIVLDWEKYSGEVVTMGEEVIHLLLARKQ